MKRRNVGFSVYGYILFFITIAVNFTVSILIYSLIQDKPKSFIALIMILCILISALICTVVDIIRRRLMIEKPVSDILEATERIARGEFDIQLVPKHIYSKYDAYDRIMDNINILASELGKNEVLKNDFISNVSHEIKTPLALIQNYAKALQDKQLKRAEEEKYIQVLIDASARLSHLVSNILKLNKLENQEVLPSMEKLELGEVLRECILSFEGAFEQKKLDLECDIEDMTLVSSKSYLEIIFNNLIANAIKFTESGKIEISLKREGKYAVVGISDTGCGISRETGQHIFDKFYQGDTAHTMSGNGLGLAIVKKIVELHQGSVRIANTGADGTTFEVVLPMDMPAAG